MWALCSCQPILLIEYGAQQNNIDSPLTLPPFPMVSACSKSPRKCGSISKDFTGAKSKARDNRISCINFTQMKIPSGTRCILQVSIWPVKFTLYWLNLMSCKISFTIGNSYSNLEAKIICSLFLKLKPKAPCVSLHIDHAFLSLYNAACPLERMIQIISAKQCKIIIINTSAASSPV